MMDDKQKYYGKYSFISKVISISLYEHLKGGKYIVSLATGVLVVLWVVSFFVHWDFINDLLGLTTGTSLVFIIYVFLVIVLLDKGIEVELEEEPIRGSVEYILPAKRPRGYVITVVYALFAIILGSAAIYVSEKYSDQYNFECETFLVDHKEKTYHIVYWKGDCEIAKESYDLVKMQGYQIDKSYILCEECAYLSEEAIEEYNRDRFVRR